MIDPKNIQQTKYQAVTLTVAAAAAAGIKTSQAAGLDDSYDVCDGILITEITNGTIANGQYNVAIETPTGTPIEFSPIQAYSVTKNDGTNPNERFVDVLFDAKAGKNAKLLAELPASPAAEMVIQAVFRLRRLLVPIALPKV